MQAQLENWSMAPLFLGAYTNNHPGYFTTVEGLYAKPAGNILFAGEHTSERWQGYMNGAVESAKRAVAEIEALEWRRRSV